MNVPTINVTSTVDRLPAMFNCLFSVSRVANANSAAKAVPAVMFFLVCSVSAVRHFRACSFGRLRSRASIYPVEIKFVFNVVIEIYPFTF
jgi:hypothetical protein